MSNFERRKKEREKRRRKKEKKGKEREKVFKYVSSTTPSSYHACHSQSWRDEHTFSLHSLLFLFVFLYFFLFLSKRDTKEGEQEREERWNEVRIFCPQNFFTVTVVKMCEFSDHKKNTSFFFFSLFSSFSSSLDFSGCKIRKRILG